MPCWPTPKSGPVFGALIGSFWGRSRVQKLVWGLHGLEQLLFSMFSSILTFDFDLILGSLLTFFGLNGLFRGPKTDFWFIHVAEQLLFSIVTLILIFILT